MGRPQRLRILLPEQPVHNPKSVRMLCQNSVYPRTLEPAKPDLEVIEVDKAAAQEVSTKVAKEEAEAQREIKVLWSPWAILRFIT